MNEKRLMNKSGNNIMRKLKLVFILALIGLTIFALCACGSGGGDNGGTNVQEMAVDEGDIIKQQDGILYCLQPSGFVIVNTNNGNPKIVAKATLPDLPKARPVELYIKQDHLVTIVEKSQTTAEGVVRYNTVVTVYDISGLDMAGEAQTLTAVYNLDIQAGFYTSRLVSNENNLYIVTKNEMRNPALSDDDLSYTSGQTNDDVLTEDNNMLGTQILYKENNTDRYIASQHNVCSDETSESYYKKQNCAFFRIPLSGVDNTTQCTTFSYFGAVLKAIYMSDTTMYPVFNNSARRDEESEKGCYAFATRNYVVDSIILKLDRTTLMHRGKITLKNYEIYDRYAMKEMDGKLFVVATKCTGVSTSLFSFDENFNLIGQLTDIAKNEDVYSVRYESDGDKDYCYITTFRQVDPLFKVEITNPRSPKMLGQLKIEGVSTYLHPLGGGRMIGVGYGGTQTGLNGKIKVSLFDTSGDAPIEINSIEINGTTAEVLSNPRAFCLLGDNFGFEVSGRVNGNAITKFFVFGVKNDALECLATVEGVLTDDSGTMISCVFARAFLIGDHYYFVSNNGVKACNSQTLEETGSIITSYFQEEV